MQERPLDRWFRAFFESSPDAFVVIDSTGRILAANPGVATQLGHAPDELRGRSIGSIVPSLAERSGTAAGGSGDYEGRDRHGATIPLEVSLAPIQHGEQRMTLARLSKRVLLAETVELPTNSVVLEPDFLLILMHELRTPLQAMLGWTQLVRSTRQDAQAIESALAAIERNIQWQALVIEDLLELARSRSGDLPLEIRRVRVGAVIESAVEQIAEAAAAKRIRVVQRLRGEDGVIRADADRLARGIWRLLSDAVRFTRESGEIEIRSERIGSSIRIIVRDDGGANDSVSSHASGWFRRTASSTADFSAMGVGLGNLQRLVAMHGGQVGAESAGEGRGASFSLTVPLVDEVDGT